MPKGKRKRSSKGKGFRRRVSTRYGPFGAGPMGGVRPGHRGTRQVTIPAPIQGVDRLFLKVSKSIVGQFATGAAGAYQAATLKLNSANDPLGSLGSGPPVGLAAYCGASPALYGAYIVHAWKVHIEMTNGATNFAWGFTARPASMAAATSVAQIGSTAYGQMRIITPGQISKLTKYGTTGQVYGQSPQTVAIADSFSALYNADPSSEIIGDLGAQEVTGSTQLISGYILTITQWVECFGRNTPT